jgi:hypothetical protein
MFAHSKYVIKSALERGIRHIIPKAPLPITQEAGLLVGGVVGTGLLDFN